jgi:hypothetical protein
MQVDKRKIESSLVKKGFIRDEATHHTYFYHEYNGKRTEEYNQILKEKDLLK